MVDFAHDYLRELARCERAILTPGPGKLRALQAARDAIVVDRSAIKRHPTEPEPSPATPFS